MYGLFRLEYKHENIKKLTHTSIVLFPQSCQFERALEKEMKIAFVILCTIAIGSFGGCLMLIMADITVFVACGLSLIVVICVLGMYEIQKSRAHQELLESGCTFSTEEVIGVKTYRCKGIEKPFTLQAFMDGKVKLPEKTILQTVSAAPPPTSAEKVE